MSCLFFVDRSGSKLEPKGSIFAQLRSAQSTRPPDEFRPIFRRYKIEILYHCKKAAAHIEATDASAEMIAEAKRDNQSAKLHFSVQDMFRLPYADKSFEVVIVSNALHIVPQPEKALAEIHRVLKDDGVLIAPTFTHAGNSFSGKVRAFFMKLAGFPLHSKWTSEEYLRFLRQNGWAVRKSVVLKASFPLTYAECEKTEV